MVCIASRPAIVIPGRGAAANPEAMNTEAMNTEAMNTEESGPASKSQPPQPMSVSMGSGFATP
jgi:hypothetical protein